MTAAGTPPAVGAARSPQAPPSVSLRSLTISIPTARGIVQPTAELSLDLQPGEVLGVVGETGSGKTVTCRAMLGLLPTPTTLHTGTVTYPGLVDDDVLSLSNPRLRRQWGRYISMIPQNPMTSLNPVHRIGDQIGEAVAAHRNLSRRDRDARVLELMTRVGIPAPERRRDDYPHQFSGGMLQRTLIAIALAGDPRVIVADEPTTALDVIIQDQILNLLLVLQQSSGMSLVLVSHDLAVIAQTCDRVAVMYAGQLVELADTTELLASPRHPYTAALLRSMPGAAPHEDELETISGTPPRLIDPPPGCRFAPRCDFAEPACSSWESDLLPIRNGTSPRQVRCRRHEELCLQTSNPRRQAPSAQSQAPADGNNR